MQFNQNYPWYLQSNAEFSTLLREIFDVASKASPLDVYKIAYPDELEGVSLLQYGQFWGITGDPAFTDAMIYNIDSWSQGKVWTGGLGEVKTRVFRNIIKAKAYMQGRQFCLSSLKTALGMIFDGTGATITVLESDMHFEIHIAGSNDVIREFIEMKSLDPVFFGHIPGISYTYTYDMVSE